MVILSPTPTVPGFAVTYANVDLVVAAFAVANTEAPMEMRSNAASRTVVIFVFWKFMYSYFSFWVVPTKSTTLLCVSQINPIKRYKMVKISLIFDNISRSTGIQLLNSFKPSRCRKKATKRDK
jgi:L-cystine uptake protein TcyP (sodium:dicarboxylate symporter family)